jgi:hypothetical protein
MIHIKKGGNACYSNGCLVPVLGIPFIDKLYITVEFLPEHHTQIISNFEELIESGYGLKSNKSAYGHNLKISGNFPNYEGEALIQCSPHKSKYNFFRLEMTPARIDMDNLKTILDKALPGGYAGVLKNGRVNRMDLSVDIANVSVAEIIARYPKMRVERHFGMGIKNQTKILGSPTGKKSFTLYDKQKQLQTFKAKHPGTTTALPVGKLTRLEMSIKKTNKTLDNILVLPNPLKHLTLVAYPGSMTSKSYDPSWSLFLSVCEDRGVKAALDHFNPIDKAVYALRLKQEGKSEWWQPEIVWQGLQEAIEGLKIVKGNTPCTQVVIGNEPGIADYGLDI